MTTFQFVGLLVQAGATVALAVFTYRLWKSTAALAGFTDRMNATTGRMLQRMEDAAAEMAKVVGEMTKAIDKRTFYAHGTRLTAQWDVKDNTTPILTIKDERGEPLKVDNIEVSHYREDEEPSYRKVESYKYERDGPPHMPIVIKDRKLPKEVDTEYLTWRLNAIVAYRDVVTNEAKSVRVSALILKSADGSIRAQQYYWLYTDEQSDNDDVGF